MKELKHGLEHPYKAVVVNYLNLLLGKSPSSTEYCSSELKTSLHRHFPYSLSPEETDIVFPLMSLISGQDKCNLFKIIIRICGLHFAARSLEEFSVNPQSFEYQKPFDTTDLLEIPERVKHMNIVAVAQGYVLKKKAEELKTSSTLRSDHAGEYNITA